MSKIKADPGSHNSLRPYLRRSEFRAMPINMDKPTTTISPASRIAEISTTSVVLTITKVIERY
jgi:hypothetical protein